MRIVFRLGALIVMAGMLAGAAREGFGAGEREAAVTIVSPQTGESVGPLVEMHGKLQGQGQPVVLVRAKYPGEVWWVQFPVKPTGKDTFASFVRFGSDQTRNGAKFTLVVVLARNAQDMQVLTPGSPINAIPASVTRSADVEVVFRREEEAAATEEAISEPKEGQSVDFVEEIRGQVKPGVRPVVLVRSAEPNETWWIQGYADVSRTGEFAALARFGNNNSPTGSRFRVAVLFCKTDAEAASFQPGKVLVRLPSNIPHSKEVEVVLRGEE